MNKKTKTPIENADIYMTKIFKQYGVAHQCLSYSVMLAELCEQKKIPHKIVLGYANWHIICDDGDNDYFSSQHAWIEVSESPNDKKIYDTSKAIINIHKIKLNNTAICDGFTMEIPKGYKDGDKLCGLTSGQLAKDYKMVMDEGKSAFMHLYRKEPIMKKIRKKLLKY
jgi:hypothetical protein